MQKAIRSGGNSFHHFFHSPRRDINSDTEILAQRSREEMDGCPRKILRGVEAMHILEIRNPRLFEISSPLQVPAESSIRKDNFASEE